MGQVLWYAQVCGNMVDQDSHEEDIKDADHGVSCSLLLLCELGPASIWTVVEEWPEYKYYHVDIQCSLMFSSLFLYTPKVKKVES